MGGLFTKYEPLETVPHVDVEKYKGTWYEISRFPHFFERNCSIVRATYTPNPDGTIQVLNQAHRPSPFSPVNDFRAKAWATDKTNSKLVVQQFWPLRGDYWVIMLDNDYKWAVVSHPSRDYLWILSREPWLDPEIYDNLVSRLEKDKFDISKIIKVYQGPYQLPGVRY